MTVSPSSSSAQVGQPAILPVDRIEVQPGFNPRHAFRSQPFAYLIEPIRAKCVIQPLAVRPKSDGEGYWLIAGERRVRAVKAIPIDPAVGSFYGYRPRRRKRRAA